MRAKIRIYKYLSLFLDNLDKTGLQQNSIDAILDNKETIFKYWKDNPDQRLTQMIFNLFNFTIFSGRFYHKECFEYLESIGVPARELVLWGSYGKDGNGPLKHMWIDDMESSHIDAILRTQKNINATYKDVFIKELSDRKYTTINNLNDPKYGQPKGKVVSLTDFLEEELDDEFVGSYLNYDIAVDIIDDFESLGVVIFVDHVVDKTDTLYFEIDKNLNARSVMDIMLVAAKHLPNKFDEVSENVFKLWWD